MKFLPEQLHGRGLMFLQTVFHKHVCASGKKVKRQVTGEKTSSSEVYL